MPLTVTMSALSLGLLLLLGAMLTLSLSLVISWLRELSLLESGVNIPHLGIVLAVSHMETISLAMP